MPAKSCAHASCTCEVAQGELVCSDHCRRVADRSEAAEEPCACGHVTCVGHPDEREERAREIAEHDPGETA